MMLKGFSGSEIVQMALNIEEYGYQYYMAAAEKVSQADLRELFRKLAEEEEKHKDIIRQMAKELDVGAGQYSDDDAYLYMDWLVQGRVFPVKVDRLASSVQDLLLGAIDREKATLLFYYGLQEVVEGKAAEAVGRLIAEEKRHVVKLSRQLQGVE